MIERELGAPPEELFATWEAEPFASASIGQVHRATLHDQTRVAVKVQFEGVEDAVAADLDNASVMTSLLGPLGTKFGVGEQMDEVRARLLEELDYEHEAKRQRHFGALFEGDATVRVPTVVGDRSTRRVLTASFARQFVAVSSTSSLPGCCLMTSTTTFAAFASIARSMYSRQRVFGSARFFDSASML